MGGMARLEHGPSPILTSVIISTYNRREALAETLNALSRQRVPGESYEVVVVDDGSTDGTWDAVKAITLPCPIQVFRHATNRGVSAGRNLAIQNARGRYLILLSDDLIVPEDFIAIHIKTLKRFPGHWVVGGFRQLPSLRGTPFGRYLDDLEESFTEGRKVRVVEQNIWELNWPTARNLSLARESLEKTGLFDETFRVTCEDQDLAHRARQVGIRFLYNEDITCLHNDQVGELASYCRFQRRGAHDTVRLCAKYPNVHGGSPLISANGYLTLRDSPILWLKKLVKRFLSTDAVMTMLFRLVAVCERGHLPERTLRRFYQLLIGLSTFRGWRDGLKTLGRERGK
jgi:GT2 family glycosyltransferase